MSDGIRWVGLDVHARASMVAIFDQATGRGRDQAGGGPPARAAGGVARDPAAGADGV